MLRSESHRPSFEQGSSVRGSKLNRLERDPIRSGQNAPPSRVAMFHSNTPAFRRVRGARTHFASNPLSPAIAGERVRVRGFTTTSVLGVVRALHHCRKFNFKYSPCASAPSPCPLPRGGEGDTLRIRSLSPAITDAFGRGGKREFDVFARARGERSGGGVN
jgi:hypothetical protein